MRGGPRISTAGDTALRLTRPRQPKPNVDASAEEQLEAVGGTLEVVPHENVTTRAALLVKREVAM